MTAKLTAPDSGRLSVNELARREGVHSATCWRWMLAGVRGIKLRAVRVGGRRFITEADWRAFATALNADLIDTPAASQAADRQGVTSC